ncbi:hypothetical protein VP01_898g1 [Puccinia sorghi]|uniref:Uncharacterized protein n=1 Tax=Puccinia sorghi TaxID=27349 RepID=A0A0L6U7U4_9BASI|nr:hypothetical protein VP01_898g1 [Puccinia sorghi]
MAEAGLPQNRMVSANETTRNDGFRQAMLKAALDTTPQLTDKNYLNAKLKLLLISKMDSVTHNNFINADNRNSAKEIWKAIKERFVSSQSSNCAYRRYIYYGGTGFYQENDRCRFQLLSNS